MRTAEVARAAGCSVQQVRDLEHAGVIPPARRAPNGYRAFGDVHVAAVVAYRSLALAVGPVEARGVMGRVWVVPLSEAVAAIGALHVTLAAERSEALRARDALLAIRAERDGAAADAADRSGMSIAELASAQCPSFDVSALQAAAGNRERLPLFDRHCVGGSDFRSDHAAVHADDLSIDV